MNFDDRLAKNNLYYDKYASEVSARTESRNFTKAFDLFLTEVDPSKTILDVGCGSGIHLREFRNRGYKALGIEPSRGMRKAVEEQNLAVIDGTFESLGDLVLPSVAGIWGAASLLHVPESALSRVFEIMSGLLPKAAPLYFTVRLGSGGKWDKYDGEESDIARYMQLFSEKQLLNELERASFTRVESWIEDSTWGRPSQWISVVARKR